MGVHDVLLLATSRSGWLGDGPSLQSLLPVLAVVAVTALVLLQTRRKWRTARRPREGARAEYSRLSAAHDELRHVDQAILQLDQLAREVSALIDTKFARLEAVIRDADERIDRLTRLQRQMQGGDAGLDVTVGDAGDPPDGAPDQAKPAGQGAGGTSKQRPPAQAGPAVDPANDQAVVYRLADRGQTPLEISQQVGQPVGEIELILALRRTRQAQALSRSSSSH